MQRVLVAVITNCALQLYTKSIIFKIHQDINY